ncbi:MAG: hypothetical protein RIC80_19060 [Cyclobacteriaceae bacterium]
MRRNKNIRMMPNIFFLGYLMILLITALLQYINRLVNSSSRPGSASGRKASG